MLFCALVKFNCMVIVGFIIFVNLYCCLQLILICACKEDVTAQGGTTLFPYVCVCHVTLSNWLLYLVGWLVQLNQYYFYTIFGHFPAVCRVSLSYAVQLCLSSIICALCVYLAAMSLDFYLMIGAYPKNIIKTFLIIFSCYQGHVLTRVHHHTCVLTLSPLV